jgi:carbon storage regulator
MLVLSRTAGESIQIGDDILIVVKSVSCGKVRIGIKAPNDVKILRSELEKREEE